MTARLHSLDEAAEILGVDRWWLWNQCRKGRITHFTKLGRYMKFTDGDLEQIIADGRPQTPTRQARPIRAAVVGITGRPASPSTPGRPARGRAS